MKSRLLVLVPALALVLPACEGAERSGNVQSGPGGSDAIELVAVDNAFRPETLELQAGTKVTVQITNDGEATHDFTIDDLDLSTGPMEPGTVMTAEFTVPDGPSTYRCTIHPGMDGEIVAG
jgi:plastocyanin